MAHFNTLNIKLKLAAKIVSDYYEGNFTDIHEHYCLCKLRKLERKYQRNPANHETDLYAFTIPLTDIPPKHYDLMVAIGWIDSLTLKVKEKQKGFYEVITPIEQGLIKLTHYITIEAYVDLLLIDIEINNLIHSPAYN
jgi:hypothetical protein